MLFLKEDVLLLGCATSSLKKLNGVGHGKAVHLGSGASFDLSNHLCLEVNVLCLEEDVLVNVIKTSGPRGVRFALKLHRLLAFLDEHGLKGEALALGCLAPEMKGRQLFSYTSRQQSLCSVQQMTVQAGVRNKDE